MVFLTPKIQCHRKRQKIIRTKFPHLQQKRQELSVRFNLNRWEFFLNLEHYLSNYGHGSANNLQATQDNDGSPWEYFGNSLLILLTCKACNPCSNRNVYWSVCHCGLLLFLLWFRKLKSYRTFFLCWVTFWHSQVDRSFRMLQSIMLIFKQDWKTLWEMTTPKIYWVHFHRKSNLREGHWSKLFWSNHSFMVFWHKICSSWWQCYVFIFQKTEKLYIGLSHKNLLRTFLIENLILRGVIEVNFFDQTTPSWCFGSKSVCPDGWQHFMFVFQALLPLFSAESTFRWQTQNAAGDNDQVVWWLQLQPRVLLW